jgi:hypothetical protein
MYTTWLFSLLSPSAYIWYLQVDMSNIKQNTSNAEHTHFSAVYNVLQGLQVGILHKRRVLPQKALDVLSALEDMEDFFSPEEKSFLIYKSI